MPRITESCLNRIQEANDIVAVVESYGLKLRQVGSNLVALCPIHKEKTPSFNVVPRLQIFKCFGCGVAGGVFEFVKQMERCEFREAVELLAHRAGIELEFEGGGRQGFDDEAATARKGQFWANRVACAYFERALADPNEGRAAREYLLGRGFTEETIRDWRLGWAPDDYEGLLTHLRRHVREHAGEQKVDQAVQMAVQAGVLRRREENGSCFDFFRGRVIFPILDHQSRVVGFGGRVLVERPNTGKYMNTPEGPVFTKRKLLFGLNRAAKEIGLQKSVIVVEGYTDVIMCHQHGLRNVVATLGTSLTEDHVAVLRRYVREGGRVVALFDADEAGRKATERATRIFMEEDVPLSVVRDMAVKDAGEFLPTYGAEAFQAVLDKAEDAFAHTLRLTLGKDGDKDVSRRAAAVAEVMDLVNRSPNAVKRAMMRKDVATIAGVPESDLPKPAASAPSPARSDARGRDPRSATRGDGAGAPRGERWTRGLSTYRAPGAYQESPPPAASGVAGNGSSENNADAKREALLLLAMLERGEWSDSICDHYPPDEWHCADCARAAAWVRDRWHAGETPSLEALIRAVPEVRGVEPLVDAMMGQGGPAPTVPMVEEILEYVRLRDIKEEARELQEAQAEALRLDDEARLHELLKKRQELKQRIDGARRL